MSERMRKSVSACALFLSVGILIADSDDPNRCESLRPFDGAWTYTMTCDGAATASGEVAVSVAESHRMTVTSTGSLEFDGDAVFSDCPEEETEGQVVEVDLWATVVDQMGELSFDCEVAVSEANTLCETQYDAADTGTSSCTLELQKTGR